jgi:hypothetical protein
LRVVADESVRDEALEFQRAVSSFHRELFAARMVHWRIHETGDGDTGEALMNRVQLGKQADEITDRFKRLEKAVRRETAR